MKKHCAEALQCLALIIHELGVDLGEEDDVAIALP